jgi:hypothetical protein
MQFLSTKTLGVIGIFGAPWLFIDFINNGLYDRYMFTSESGIRNFLFTTGWICSVLALYQLRAMGTKRWQKIVMIIQLVLLCLSNIWSIWEILEPHSPSPVYFIIGNIWPFMGCFMIIPGIAILKARKLKGWKRYIPLLAGLWTPVSIAVYLIFNGSLGALFVNGLSSAIIFILLGLSLVIDNYEHSINRTPSLK